MASLQELRENLEILRSLLQYAQDPFDRLDLAHEIDRTCEAIQRLIGPDEPRP